MGAWIEIFDATHSRAGYGSLLSWERGLKYLSPGKRMRMKPSLLSWERGLKSLNRRIQGVTDYVAPLVGAWIEIFDIANMNVAEQSLLSWERGLK